MSVKFIFIKMPAEFSTSDTVESKTPVQKVVIDFL